MESPFSVFIFKGVFFVLYAFSVSVSVMVRTRVRALWNDRQETRGERGVATRDMISWTHHVKHFELPLRMKSAIQVKTFMDCDFTDFMRDTVLAWFAETLTTSTDYQSADMLSPVSQRPTDCHTQHCAELLICYQECPERISRAFPGHYLCVCVCVCVCAQWSSPPPLMLFLTPAQEEVLQGQTG